MISAFMAPVSTRIGSSPPRIRQPQVLDAGADAHVPGENEEARLELDVDQVERLDLVGHPSSFRYVDHDANKEPREVRRDHDETELPTARRCLRGVRARKGFVGKTVLLGDRGDDRLGAELARAPRNRLRRAPRLSASRCRRGLCSVGAASAASFLGGRTSYVPCIRCWPDVRLPDRMSNYPGFVGLESFVGISEAMRAATCIWRSLAPDTVTRSSARVLPI